MEKHQGFRETLASEHREKAWFPHRAMLLSVSMPDGLMRVWQAWYCPQTGEIAENVAHYRRGDNG